MSMHGTPSTPAQKFARHLEMQYGLQLDPIRHKVLCDEIQAFGEEFAKSSAAEEAEEGENSSAD